MNKKNIFPIKQGNSETIIGAALISSGKPGPDAQIVQKLRGAEKIMLRPSYGEMIEVLAVHYEISEDTVIEWLKGLDL